MWTNIRIEVPEECWDVRTWVKSIRPFVLICLERSHRNLLDISFILSGLGYGEEVSVWRLRSALAARYDVDALLRCLGDGGRSLMDYESEPYYFDEEILSLLEDLTGPGGELMMRWGSFELRFPRDDDLADTIWERIFHPTPNLTTLRLFGLQHLDNRETLPHVLTDLSQLRNFYIDDVAHWEFLSLSPSSLRHIQVQTHIENRPALQLSRFRNLRSLQISCEDVDWSELPSDAGPTHITLPRLQDLTLVAPFEHLARSDFNLPSLKRLFLVCSSEDSPKRLPSLHPVFVAWNPSQRLDDGRNSVHLESILREFLCHFTTAADLAVPASQKLALLGLLARMSAEGPFPHSWEAVSFHTEDKIVERVVIHEFLKDQ
jgi:hypothetical protein